MSIPIIIISFVVSFFAGVTATILTPSILKMPKWKPLMWLSGRLYEHGIEYIYENQDDARKDILNDLDETEWIKIYTFRGRSFLEKTADPKGFPFAIMQTKVPVKLIIADALDDEKNNETDNPVKDRAKETKNELYRNTLLHTLNLAAKWKLERKDFDYRLHNNCATFRLIIFHQRLYLAFFKEDKMGPDLKVIRVKAKSLIYDGFLRFFMKEFELTSNHPTPNL